MTRQVYRALVGAFAMLLILGSMALTFSAKAATPITASKAKALVLKPCKFEDSRNCYWLANCRGNGKGHSFLNIRGKVYRFKYDGPCP